MHRLVSIRRYPIKSAAAEHLHEVAVGGHGLDGDRTWTCLDADGTIGSAKQPRLWERLLDVDAAYLPDGGVTVTVPGGDPAPAGPAADAALSSWLGRPVRLTRTAPRQPRRHHWWPDEPGMIPEWAADAEPGGDDVVAMRSSEADGRFFDFGAVHLVTTSALARLSAEHGGEIDPARFRPNLILDLPDDPEPGQRIAIGPDLLLEIALPTPRCVIPSLTHGPAPADRTLLKTLATHHRTTVPGFGRATCFGLYATTLTPGTVTTGDPVELV